jgi:AcrR family transcriptional regulator
MSEGPGSDPTGAPRRERRRLEMQGRILEAALGRFQDVGYDATTVAEICEAADIAYGTFFNHFPTKLDLLRALVDDAQQGLAVRVEELGKGPGSTREKLVPLFEMLTRNAKELGPGHRNLVEQMVTLGHQESPADRDRRLHSIFRGFLEAGVARGDVPAAELEALTEIVLGAYTSLMLGWVHFDDYPVQERSESIAALLSRILSERTNPTRRT